MPTPTPTPMAIGRVLLSPLSVEEAEESLVGAGVAVRDVVAVLGL